LVGVTVLCALIVLGWMILQFGGTFASPFAPAQMPVRLITDHADGLSEGSPVFYRGVATGHVVRVYLFDRDHVYVDAMVDQNPPLPANLKAIIRMNGLIGGASSVVLQLADEAPQGEIKAHAEIPATYSGFDLLPPQFADLAKELTDTARQFRESHVITDADAQVKKIGQLVESLNAVIGDEETRANLKTSIANIRKTTDDTTQIASDVKKFTGKLDQMSTDAGTTIAQAKVTLAKADTNIDTLSRQIGDRLTQTATLIDHLNSISEKVNKGQGTAGQLVNDNRLYESLVDTSRELNGTVKDLKRLVEQWEQEGVSLHLK
jgi:phospholipid/cholesterol/gamma-HCH transport system substrate-binding protein